MWNLPCLNAFDHKLISSIQDKLFQSGSTTRYRVRFLEKYALPIQIDGETARVKLTDLQTKFKEFSGTRPEPLQGVESFEYFLQWTAQCKDDLRFQWIAESTLEELKTQLKPID